MMNMARKIAIKSLIREARTDHRGGDAEAGRLPPAIAESLPLWNIVAERAGQMLSVLFDAELAADVEVRVATHAQLRKTASAPGVLVFLDPPDKQAFVRFPGRSAQVLSGFLLRAPEIAQPEDIPPEDLDGLVTVPVIEAISGLIYAAFGIPLRLPRDLAFQVVWPLTPPPPEPRLFVAFRLKFANGMHADIEILLRDLQETVFQDLLDRRSRSLDPGTISVPLAGILSRWSSDAADLAHLQPGLRIMIPGGDLQQVTIEAEGVAGGIEIARASLGTVRGRHALKVMSTTRGT